MDNMDLSNHFTLTTSGEIQDITQPLERQLGINYFSFIKIADNPSRTILCNSPHFLRAYYLAGLFKRQRLNLSNVQTSLQHRIWSQFPHSPDNIIAREHGIYHRASFVVKFDKNYEIYNFGSPVDKNLDELPYLNNPQLIKQFILYFREKAAGLIQKAQAHPIKIDHCSDCPDFYLSSAGRTTHALPAPQKRYFIDDTIYLTRREVDCLRWLSLGKTAEEIAMITATSKRTVQEHIGHIKDKLGCASLFQLGKKITELALLD